MGEAAVKLSKAINYNSVGTVEFLVDKDRKFYFMEMNARIQVEHPVTEKVTGIDLVKEQIKAAAGEKLTLKQKKVHFTGHSIECRINAEDPDNYMPSPGKITEYNVPGGPGVRVDSAVYCNYTVPPHYDSLLAKLIVHAENRKEAIKRMKVALDEFHVAGVKTNIALHKRIMKDHDFIAGNVDINFLSRYSKSK